jgi:hypothetical protein
MSNQVERHFVDAHGPDDEAIPAGIRWLAEFANGRGLSTVAIFVSTLSQVESLGRTIGNSAAAVLKKNKYLTSNGLRIELLIERGLPMSYTKGPVLGVWVDDKQLDRLERLGAPGLTAIPWISEDINGWKASWNPLDSLPEHRLAPIRR